jgi:hypothetical protein
LPFASLAGHDCNECQGVFGRGILTDKETDEYEVRWESRIWPAWEELKAVFSFLSKWRENVLGQFAFDARLDATKGLRKRCGGILVPAKSISRI